MSHRPLVHQRYYSTPALVRLIATSLPVAITDAQLRQQIAMVSVLIDRVTNQTFWPLDEDVIVRGQGDNKVRHPRVLPILNIETVSCSAMRNRFPPPRLPMYYLTEGAIDEWTVLDNAFWVANDRNVYLTRLSFPDGLRNVRLVGTFGWLENSRGLIETTLTVELANGDTVVEVDDASLFRVRDIIDVVGPDTETPIRAIIEEIDYATNEFTIDVVETVSPAAIGSRVISWGQVPEQVEYVLAMWVQLMALNGAPGSGSGAIASGRLKRERTDSYEYELFPATDGTAYTGELTGDPLLDRMLDAYCAPAYVGFV